MLKNVKIENFRSFSSFELQKLGSINLLVGANNSGKTSILEAIQLLCSQANLEPLAEMMNSRGEYFRNRDKDVPEKDVPELDIRHLFNGHEIKVDSKFSVSGMNESDSEEVVTVVIISQRSQLDSLIQQHLDSLIQQHLDPLIQQQFKELPHKLTDNSSVLSATWKRKDFQGSLIRPLSLDGSLRIDYTRRDYTEITSKMTTTQFVTPSSLTIKKMTELFDQVVLTPEEDLVLEALQTIEPEIERIAVVSDRNLELGFRGGFVVRLSDKNQRIPIGSLGDGIWRILGLALAIVSVKNGYLFIDEIDSGLHFSAMSDMWKLIWKTAQKLDVQVLPQPIIVIVGLAWLVLLIKKKRLKMTLQFTE